MTWYQVALAAHALVAVLGIGQVLALVLLAQDARPGNNHLPATLAMMGKLARVTSISLALMLLTGIGVMAPTQFAYGRARWFQVAFVLFLVLGFFNGQLQRALRVARGPASDASARALTRLSSLGWIMCGLVTLIVILMAAKPF
jgi:uncharacterized membrane protein